jgi:hypothetical protein
MSVQSITNDLSSWLRQAPDRLRIDFTTLDTHVDREIVSINLHFYSCINMTARPLVFYIIQRRIDAGLLGGTEDWKEGLAPNTIAVIDNCIKAARATTLIMDAAAKQNLIGMKTDHRDTLVGLYDHDDLLAYSYIWLSRW